MLILFINNCVNSSDICKTIQQTVSLLFPLSFYDTYPESTKIMQDIHMYDGNGIMFSMEFISNETQRVRFESGFE